MKYEIYAESEKICFALTPPKPHARNQTKVNLSAEAFDILENIYAQTSIPISQIASEMIKFASKHVRIEICPFTREVTLNER